MSTKASAASDLPILCPHCGCKDPSLVDVLKRRSAQGPKVAQEAVFCNVCGRASVKAEKG